MLQQAFEVTSPWTLSGTQKSRLTPKQHDYLMNAILSLAAAHLWTLNPSSLRYHQLALSSFSRSLQLFRSTLSMPITASNVCLALVAFAIPKNPSFCPPFPKGQQTANNIGARKQCEALAGTSSESHQWPTSPLSNS